MADKDDNQPEHKELRDKLEAALAENKTLHSTVSSLQAQVLMPALNERQRRVVMRELAEDKLDPTEENVAQVAEDLGYKLTPEPPPPTDNTSPPNNQSQDNHQDDQQPPKDIMVSLSQMNAIDQAQFHAQRGNLTQDLETEMRAAKNADELRDIIRSKGAASGIVHEWDDQ